MGFIEKHAGCSPPCFWPREPYYTIFGTELRFLMPHLIFSIILCVVLFVVLFFLNKKGKISLPIYWAIAISIISIVVLFLLFAYLFPVTVFY